MAKKRLYRCDDCGTRRFVSSVELSKAAKPRCKSCGCTRLEMCSEEAADERADIASARLQQRAQVERKQSRR